MEEVGTVQGPDERALGGGGRKLKSKARLDRPPTSRGSSRPPSLPKKLIFRVLQEENEECPPIAQFRMVRAHEMCCA